MAQNVTQALTQTEHTMKKYLPLISVVLPTVAAVAAPDVQSLIAANPTVSVILTTLLGVLAAFAPAPHKQD